MAAQVEQVVVTALGVFGPGLTNTPAQRATRAASAGSVHDTRG